jgi:hypothetical protein
MQWKNFSQVSNIPRIFTIILLFWWSIKFWPVRGDYIMAMNLWEFNFLHVINLVIHEAGHFIFFWAPRQIMVIMGSGLQIMIPFVFMIAFIRQIDWFASSVMSWWGFQSVLDISYYIADAKDRAMPLITGDPDSHDWWYLFSQWGLLDYSINIGRTIMYFSFFGMILSIIFMIITLFIKKELWYKDWI